MECSSDLKKAVASLPEVYQPIYGHKELYTVTSRGCEDRLVHIKKVYDALSKKLGRPLRVLDLGCAQGFISLTIASWGAEVTGVDFMDPNIDVCRLLAEENAGFKVSFVHGKIEVFLSKIEEDQYDLVLGLSVFHHLCHLYGWKTVQTILYSISDKVSAGIFELAIREEPLYWAESLPPEFRDLLAGFSCVKFLGYHGTHLSEYQRPLLYASSRYIYFNDIAPLKIDSWKDSPYEGAPANVHRNFRRYFFCEDKFVKMCYLRDHAKWEKYEPNAIEYHREIDFLKDINGLKEEERRAFVPAVCAVEENEEEIWIARDKIEGQNLLDVIGQENRFDPREVIRKTLEQLIFFEEHGYYCSDLRIWNLLIDGEGNIFFIDYGAMDKRRLDCSWPWSLTLSFVIFIHEVLERKVDMSLIRGMKLFTSLKKYLTPRQIDGFLRLNPEKNGARQLYDILFSNDIGDELYRNTVMDKEILAVEEYLGDSVNQLSEFGRIFESHARESERAMAEMKEQIAGLRELIVKLTDTVIAQQETIERLEQSVR